MKYALKLDKTKRVLANKCEIKRLSEKTLFLTQSVKPKIRIKHFYKLSKLNGEQSKIRNKCVITGRSRSVYRFCKLSRIKFRELASAGVLPGIKKAIW